MSNPEDDYQLKLRGKNTLIHPGFVWGWGGGGGSLGFLRKNAFTFMFSSESVLT